jgi:hypothetical protein
MKVNLKKNPLYFGYLLETCIKLGKISIYFSQNLVNYGHFFQRNPLYVLK